MGSHIKSFQGKLSKGKMWKLLICVWLWTIVCDGVPHHKTAKTFNIFSGDSTTENHEETTTMEPEETTTTEPDETTTEDSDLSFFAEWPLFCTALWYPYDSEKCKVPGVCHAQNQSGLQLSSASNQKPWCLGDVSLAMLESDSVTIVWER